MSDISNEEYATSEAIGALKARVKELEGVLTSADYDRAKWSFFTRLPHAQQKHLIDTCRNPYDLESALAELMGRPNAALRYPGNDAQLFEEAGRWADTYRGEGWMRIRAMLADFHKFCTALKM